MFSLLWSEHCAYKHSRKLLRRLPTEGERVVMGPGENAGAVDVGNGYAVAFKVESHNHPSAVEPFQGAATGVGGILRDVFALGARPIAILDSLRFGELDSERSRFLLDGAVRGIGHYGNSIGVATVGGEIYFEAPYEHNCLVNAMCVGIAKHDGHGARRRRRGRQRGGADGRLDRARRDRRRLGAGLGRAGRGRRGEAPDRADRRPLRGVEGARVLPGAAGEGAAGLAAGPRRRRAHLLGRGDGLGGRGRDRPRRGAGAAARGRHGALRDHGLRVPGADARRGRAGARCRRCWRSARSGRPGSAEIGVVTDSGRVRVLRGDEVVGDMPVEALVDGCPLYDLSPAEPEGWIYGNRATLATGVSAEDELLALLASPSIASKRWAFEQYDSVVGSRTVRRPESADAAVLQLPESGNAIAVSIDGNGRRVACDPYAGTVEAVLECAQNLACVGAEPLGLTNCLNFGNPEKPAPAWQLDRAVSGLADACEALGVPVVGGNVSLYNEGPDGPIYPTPVVGMVGELPDPARVAGSAFAREGDAIALLGPFAPSLAGSELAKLRGELDQGLPQPDIAAVAAACATVRDAVRAGHLASAHDVSDGGLACALAECAIGGGPRLPGRRRAAARTRLLPRGGPLRRGHAAASWSAAIGPGWRLSAPP